MMNKTKIVCTIGPASSSPGKLKQLLKAGMNIARLNLAHGSADEHIEVINNIRNISEEQNTPCSIMADIPGPEIRFEGLSQVQKVNTNEIIKLSLSKENSPLFKIIENNDQIIIGDGDILLTVKSVKKNEITAKVIDGGILKQNQRLNIRGKTINLPSLTKKDISNIEWAAKSGIDFFALSFVKDKQDILSLKKLLRTFDSNAEIIAKIETIDAVKNIDEIIENSDAMMIARGDLGICFSPEETPIIQKEVIKKVLRVGKPIITATQMLESMVYNSRPTRAEASDVANAIFDGTDAVMLSEETAIGQYPVETVKVMSRIAKRTEESLDNKSFLLMPEAEFKVSSTHAISFACVELAYTLKAKAIVTSTQSGTTARQVAKYKPNIPIIAITPNQGTYRRLLLSWGVIPILIKSSENIDEMFDRAVEVARGLKIAKKGDTLIITAGVKVNVPGTTNLIKVETI